MAQGFGRSAVKSSMRMESLYGVTTVELAALGQVHLSTARRWKRTGKCPRWLDRLVRVCHHGELDHVQRAWTGWRLERGQLISPEGWQFTPGAVRAIPFMQAQIRTYQEKQRCIQQADWIQQRYVDPTPERTA
jgi:hypothetical protein